MNGIFEKFSLYDLFGIYIPGAMMAFILKCTGAVCLFKLGEVDRMIIVISKAVVGIPNAVYYSLIAFFIGIVIHEAGKDISERFNIFEAEKIEKWVLGKASPGKAHSKIIKKIAKHNNESLMKNIANEKRDEIKIVSFELALNNVRYSNNNRNPKASKYHYFYGLSRGLALDVLIGNILTIILKDLDIITYKVFLLAIFEGIVLFLILYCRAYRYCISWVKNIYMQYAYDNNLALNNVAENISAEAGDNLTAAEKVAAE